MNQNFLKRVVLGEMLFFLKYFYLLVIVILSLEEGFEVSILLLAFV